MVLDEIVTAVILWMSDAPTEAFVDSAFFFQLIGSSSYLIFLTEKHVVEEKE